MWLALRATVLRLAVSSSASPSTATLLSNKLPSLSNTFLPTQSAVTLGTRRYAASTQPSSSHARRSMNVVGASRHSAAPGNQFIGVAEYGDDAFRQVAFAQQSPHFEASRMQSIKFASFVRLKSNRQQEPNRVARGF